MMTAREIVKTLEPEDGWWKSGTEDTLMMAVLVLSGAGLPPEVIREVLGDVICAIREEYGE